MVSFELAKSQECVACQHCSTIDRTGVHANFELAAVAGMTCCSVSTFGHTPACLARKEQRSPHAITDSQQ
eukprot:1259913-Amphidinium_carterae.1